jgi:Na+/H+-dicarboxylate symporter
VRLSSRVAPALYLKSGLDAFLTAFSTSSSIATMPVTYECATAKIGLDESCASLGIFVGGTFNHDGGALFQTMAAVFVSQSLGLGLTVGQFALLAVLSLFSSVATAGIPQGGLVMMVAIFSALGLPVEYAALLLPLDLILDRARTTINVAGDLAATCIADRDSRSYGGAGDEQADTELA